jgi:hypothetical protein
VSGVGGGGAEVAAGCCAWASGAAVTAAAAAADCRNLRRDGFIASDGSWSGLPFWGTLMWRMAI